jgi:hypothetical protein
MQGYRLVPHRAPRRAVAPQPTSALAPRAADVGGQVADDDDARIAQLRAIPDESKPPISARTWLTKLRSPWRNVSQNPSTSAPLSDAASAWATSNSAIDALLGSSKPVQAHALGHSRQLLHELPHVFLMLIVSTLREA